MALKLVVAGREIARIGLRVPSFVVELWRVPRSFVTGLTVGIAAPILTLAGIVGGIYLFTRKVPFVSDIMEEGEERRLVLSLMTLAEAQAALTEQAGRFTRLVEQVKEWRQ